jgi:hypothetical protein
MVDLDWLGTEREGGDSGDDAIGLFAHFDIYTSSIEGLVRHDTPLSNRADAVESPVCYPHRGDGTSHTDNRRTLCGLCPHPVMTHCTNTL